MTSIAGMTMMLLLFNLNLSGYTSSFQKLDVDIEDKNEAEFRKMSLLESMMELDLNKTELPFPDGSDKNYTYERKSGLIPMEYFAKKNEGEDIGYKKKDGHCYIEDVPLLDGENYAYYVTPMDKLNHSPVGYYDDKTTYVPSIDTSGNYMPNTTTIPAGTDHVYVEVAGGAGGGDLWCGYGWLGGGCGGGRGGIAGGKLSVSGATDLWLLPGSQGGKAEYNSWDYEASGGKGAHDGEGVDVNDYDDSGGGGGAASEIRVGFNWDWASIISAGGGQGEGTSDSEDGGLGGNHSWEGMEGEGDGKIIDSSYFIPGTTFTTEGGGAYNDSEHPPPNQLVPPKGDGWIKVYKGLDVRELGCQEPELDSTRTTVGFSIENIDPVSAPALLVRKAHDNPPLPVMINVYEVPGDG